MNIRTRFSPSPTGMIHLGNARTAIFSALYAKCKQGVFVLRIEDTDAARSEERYVDALQEDLHWLGVDWQEGPVVGGAFGPYWQSQRQDSYARFYDILAEKKLIYPCFCSDQELMLTRKIQMSRGLAPRYSGTCRALSQSEVEKRISEGKKPAWRFIVPVNKAVEFVDSVKGLQSFNSDDIGDFIVRRADSTAPFLFCNAIDDALMEISHVLRGEDHVANTPRQIMILDALGLPKPTYGHLSLIVGDDGAPLSKRHGSFSLDEMRNHGYLPLALLNYLARLGHSCDVQSLLGIDELAKHFQLDKLSRSPARFDKVQLLYWQKMAVQALDTAALWRWLGAAIANMVPEQQRELFAETIKSNVEFPQDAVVWANVFFQPSITMDEEAVEQISAAGKSFFVEAENAVDQHGTALDLVLAQMKANLGVGGKKLFMPLRIALTGKAHGPELANIALLLGKEKMKDRLQQAIKCHA